MMDKDDSRKQTGVMPDSLETFVVTRVRDLADGFKVRRASSERFEQAKEDWKAGRYAPVPDEREFIPLPESGPAVVRYPQTARPEGRRFGGRAYRRRITAALKAGD